MPNRFSRPPFGIRWFWPAVVGMVGVTAAVAVVASVIDQGYIAQSAQAEARTVPSAPYTIAPNPVEFHFIGDSYTGGSEMDSGDEVMWWHQAAVKLGYNFTVTATGGTGYVRELASSPGVTFVTDAAKVTSGDDVIVFFGSLNDEPENPSDVQAAAEQAYATAKQNAPKAKLIVVGPPWMKPNPPADEVANSAAVHRAATAAGATWIDPLAAGWFADKSGLIGSDGTHPNDKGEAYLTQKMIPILQAAQKAAAKKPLVIG